MVRLNRALRTTQRFSERGRALAATNDGTKAGIRRQLGAAVDRRHEEIQLRTVSFASQRHADGMEERAALLRAPLLHTSSRRAELLPIDHSRAVRQLLRERTDNGACAVRGKLRANL